MPRKELKIPHSAAAKMSTVSNNEICVLPPAGTGIAAMAFSELASMSYWHDADRNPIAGLIICAAASAGKRVARGRGWTRFTADEDWEGFDPLEHRRIRSHSRHFAPFPYGSVQSGTIVYFVYSTADGCRWHSAYTPAPRCRNNSRLSYLQRDHGEPHPRELKRFAELIAWLVKKEFDSGMIYGGYDERQRQFLM